jgi:shikimate kinase
MTIFIGGPSGAGKSAVARALAGRGVSAIDTDVALAAWFTPDGHPVPAGAADFDDPDWCDRHRWRWDPARAETFLDDPAGPRFWCGFSSNMEDYADRFEAVLSLWVDAETMMARILNPRRTNPWGKDPAMRDKLLRDRVSQYARLDAVGAVRIDASGPLDDVVDAVLAAAQLNTL